MPAANQPAKATSDILSAQRPNYNQSFSAGSLAPLRLGVRTYLGKVIAVGWIGERYYWLLSPAGDIWMLPASVVEGEYLRRKAEAT